jgi:hypothetical protein
LALSLSTTAIASSALAFSCLAQRARTQRPDDSVEFLVGAGVGGERTEADRPHRRAPPSLMNATGLPSRNVPSDRVEHEAERHTTPGNARIGELVGQRLGA